MTAPSRPGAHGLIARGTRVAALDIGSDTVHLLIARVEHDDDPSREAGADRAGPVGADGTAGDGGAAPARHEVAIRAPRVVPLEQHGELLELGRRVARKGRVGRRAAARLEAVVDAYAHLARRRSDVLAVGATEALRRASDGPAIVERLEARLGTPVRVLSPSREAALGLAGAAPRLDPAGQQLLIDSGGASTELTLTDGRRRVASASLPVGAALLGASLVGDPPEALSWALGAVVVGASMTFAPDGRPVRAWATGGSAHNLAGLERTRGREGPQRLTTDELAELAGELLRQPARGLARRSGEDPDRVRILPPGLLIIAAVLARYGLDEVTVVPEGLRDGMAAAVATIGDDWWRDGAPLPTPA